MPALSLSNPSAPQPSPRSRRGRRRGFTLLELILILLILATLAAIAAPAFLGSGGVQDIKDAGYQMLALTRQARSQAIAEGTNYRLVIDVANRSYYLRRLNNQADTDGYGNYIELGEEVGTPHVFAEGVTVELDTTPPATMVQQAQATGQILPDAPAGDLPFIEFYPTGRIDPATIKVTGRKGSKLLVQCLGPSETFRMIMNDQVVKN